MSEGKPAPVMAVVSTAPDAAVAEHIGRVLVEERLAACANILEGVTSIYTWKGSLQHEREVLMVLKTTSAALREMKERLVELHPYEVPEVLVVDVHDGHQPYLDWIGSAVGQDV
ncbi:MAG: divalent-cation tolerance protein CutA [Gemmatimonadota bacterium]|nr:divalent-cation tolerance protein CutA [Gemmatimonadota bacterium]